MKYEDWIKREKERKRKERKGIGVRAITIPTAFGESATTEAIEGGGSAVGYLTHIDFAASGSASEYPSVDRAAKDRYSLISRHLTNFDGGSVLG